MNAKLALQYPNTQFYVCRPQTHYTQGCYCA